MQDTAETLKALARTNDIAKARKVALNRIMYEARTLHSIDALKASIETLIMELDTVERNIVKIISQGANNVKLSFTLSTQQPTGKPDHEKRNF